MGEGVVDARDGEDDGEAEDEDGDEVPPVGVVVDEVLERLFAVEYLLLVCSLEELDITALLLLLCLLVVVELLLVDDQDAVVVESHYGDALGVVDFFGDFGGLCELELAELRDKCFLVLALAVVFEALK